MEILRDRLMQCFQAGIERRTSQ
nr:hypothetical protein [Tanacetum cinerariifolium]